MKNDYERLRDMLFRITYNCIFIVLSISFILKDYDIVYFPLCWIGLNFIILFLLIYVLYRK